MLFFDRRCFFRRINGYRRLGCSLCCFRLLRRLVTPSHLIHVILRLGVGRRTFIPVYRSWTSIVGGQRQTVVLINVLQVTQVFYTRFDVLGGIEGIADAQHAGSPRHQLHEPLGALGRNRIVVVITLHLNDGLHQQWIDIVRLRALLHEFLNLSGRQGNCRDPGSLRSTRNRAYQLAGAAIDANRRHSSRVGLRR